MSNKKPKKPITLKGFSTKVLLHFVGLGVVSVGTLLLGAGFDLMMDDQKVTEPVGDVWRRAGIACVTAVAGPAVILGVALLACWIDGSLEKLKAVSRIIKLIGAAVAVPLAYAVSTALVSLMPPVPVGVLLGVGFALVAIGGLLSYGFWSAVIEFAREYWKLVQSLKDAPEPEQPNNKE